MRKEKSRYKYGDIILRERKGKYYVYKLETINGETKETYVGPLDKVVEAYRALARSSGGVGVSPTAPGAGFEPAQAKAYWLSRHSEDKNSDPQRRKVALVANLRQTITEGNLNAFRQWLTGERRISEETAKYYVNALTRPNITFNRNTTKAYRLFAKFAFSRGIISKEFRDEILDEVKVPQAKADLYVPTLQEVHRALEVTKQNPTIYLVYRLALESGARLSEILHMLKAPGNDIEDGDIRYYPLNWTRGHKGSYYIFHLTPLQQINISRDAVSSFARDHHVIAVKYVRKFVATKMAELQIPFDVVDFIQGRKPTRVLTQHYVQLFAIAREQYKKYAQWLKQNIGE